MPALPISTHPSIRRLALRLHGFVRARLWLQVLVAKAAGIGTGAAIGPAGGLLAPDTAAVLANWLALPGYLFLAMVQVIVIPPVVASIALGMASTPDLQALRNTGLRTELFFLVTTALAALIGLVLALALQPGSHLHRRRCWRPRRPPALAAGLRRRRARRAAAGLLDLQLGGRDAADDSHRRGAGACARRWHAK